MIEILQDRGFMAMATALIVGEISVFKPATSFTKV
jgi:hypothetical protein